VLGDVPLIGWLFRRRADSRNKRNLVVLVTPYIVKEGADLERVTEYKMDQFTQGNLDVLFEEGFIRKIKRRQEIRNEYRPSATMTSEVIGHERFGRGNIKR
jgi:type II secretory pathway component GspD/PulD (secretin)